jgi:hypothetical protein
MRVSELSAPLLDLWVALALGYRRAPDHPEPDPNGGHYWLRMGRYGSVFACPRFSFAPRDAMRVIERFKPSLEYRPAINEWASNVPHGDGLWRTGFGETAAIAVCRAVVLAHFNDDPQLDTDDEPTDYDERTNGVHAA